MGGDFEQGQGTFCFDEKPKLDGVAALVAGNVELLMRNPS